MIRPLTIKRGYAAGAKSVLRKSYIVTTDFL